MSGGNNVYKYITTGRKLTGEESLKFTLLEYMQKSTGVFNQDGMISKEEVKAIKQRAQNNKGNIWHGYISFDKEHSHLIDHPDKCIELLKQTFGEFFKDAGFDKDNMDLMAALHVDRRHHYHIHYLFFEKEPKVKNMKAAGYKYRAKGKIQMDAISRMVERVNNFALPDDLIKRRKEALALLSLNRDYLKAKSKDEARDLMEELAKELPKDKPWFYAARHMKPYREKIDKIVNVMIESDWELERADRKFRHELIRKECDLQEIMSNFYKNRVKSDMPLINDGESYEEDYPLPRIHTIEKLEWDYRRRLGNIVLGKVKYIRDNTYHYNKKLRRKSSDDVKKHLRISEKKITRELNGLFDSFAQLFTAEIHSHRNRLREIEEDIRTDHERELKEAEQEEQARQAEQEQQEANSNRWDWGK